MYSTIAPFASRQPQISLEVYRYNFSRPTLSGVVTRVGACNCSIVSADHAWSGDKPVACRAS
ncbi:hypothetical protein D3C76_841170 [compost metagenome]